MGEPEILMGIAQHYNDARNEAAEDLLLQLPSSLIATHVADAMNFCGPCYQIPTACAAGNYAISYAADLLRLQRADFVLAGGADALSRIAVVGFNKLLACATDMVRPFDLNRQGMMNAEGAGFLALERLESAERRGANILAEFIDYGVGCDAYKVTIPHPQGRGGVLALQRALSRSQLATTAVDYISAHGTGTKENDRIETAVIKQVLGDHAHRTKISSLKSMIGHTMGAASAIEAVACVKVVQQGRIPPTINLTTADPECDLDYVPNVFCEHPVNVAVSNAYAFGGNCSSIVIQRWTAMA